MATSKRRPLILAGLAGAVAMVLGAIVILSPSQAKELAVVNPLEPTVSLQDAGDDDFEVLTEKRSARAGAQLLTNAAGLAQIDYFDGSLTRIGGDTTYSLDELQNVGPTVIVGSLELGKTYHRVKELSGSGARFEVRTSHAVAAVRGTIFTVICRVGQCDVAVVEGDVDIACRMSGEQLALEAGEEVTVPDDCDPAGFSAIRPLNLDDPFLRLNLDLDGIDIEELRERLFGSPDADADPTTDDSDVQFAGGGGSGGGGSGGGGSGGGGSGGGGSGGGGSGGGGSGGGGSGGGGSGGGGSGGGGSGGGGSGGGGSGTQPTFPGEDPRGDDPDQPTTTTRPGRTTTTQPGRTTTTTRPGRTTTTTAPDSTTTTRPPGTTSTTNACSTGYPPRPC